MNIFYISNFVDAKECGDRNISMAAQKKIAYIIKCLQNNCDQIYVVSTAMTKHGCHNSWLKEVKVSKNETHIYLGAIGCTYKLLHIFRKPQMQLSLLFYLLAHTKPEDMIVFYHSLLYVSPLYIFHLFKHNKIIMEFNDWYKLHYNGKEKCKRIAISEKRVIHIANAYILASPFMIDIIDKNKPSIINYGSYDVVPGLVNRKTNVVIAYTGVVEKLRGGAFLIAESARYLPDGLKIVIAGYGSNECIIELKNLCNKINKDRGYKCVEYMKPLQGKEFDDFLSTIDIALNCHTYSKNEIWKSKYSFPSKIPLNMAYGAHIVTYKYDIITKSPFLPCCVCFDDFAPQFVAKAIEKCIEFVKSDAKQKPQEIILKLDKLFRADLKALINSLNGNLNDKTIKKNPTKTRCNS